MTDRRLPVPAIDYIVARCNLLPEVDWDRGVPYISEQQACVYGWLPPRPSDRLGPNHRDFILLQFGWSAVDGDQLVDPWTAWTTSSAYWSEDFMRRFNALDGIERNHDEAACVLVDELLDRRVRFVEDPT